LQVVELSRLVKLCLRLVLVADELPALGPTATDLSFSQCTGPAWLAKNTQLRHLLLTCSASQLGWGGTQPQALRQLTCLILATHTVPTQGLSRLDNLHRLSVSNLSVGRLLTGSAWLAKLRWLSATFEQLLHDQAALDSASSLERVSVQHNLIAAPLAETNKAHWLAVCSWMASHPLLKRVDLIVTPLASARVPLFIHSTLLDLQRQRPSLLATIVEERSVTPPGFLD
jgi:hypothetical protein